MAADPTCAVTIGAFDGVHLGHAALVARARSLAGDAGRVVALPFEPHPRAVLPGATAPEPLTDLRTRIELLRAAGADVVEPLAPTPALLALPPAEFVAWLAERHAPGVNVEGSDFRFGRRRAGDVDALAQHAAALGIGVEIVDDVEVPLSDQSLVRVSSSMVRWLLARGRVDDAHRLLGRPYTIHGTVVRGDRRGREIGVPTANVDATTMLPADGVYAGRAHLPDGRRLPAAVHVGPRATFDAIERTLEVHVVDWAGPLAEGGAEYGWPIAVEMHDWLRGQARFASVAALCEQMARDIARARACTEEIEDTPDRKGAEHARADVATVGLDR